MGLIKTIKSKRSFKKNELKEMGAGAAPKGAKNGS